MIGALIGGFIGMKLGDKYLTGNAEIPVWTGHLNADVGAPAVSVCAVRYRGKRWYRIYAVSEGDSAIVAACWGWGDVLAAIQRWEAYFASGGTLAKWNRDGDRRQREIDALEAKWQAS